MMMMVMTMRMMVLAFCCKNGHVLVVSFFRSTLRKDPLGSPAMIDSPLDAVWKREKEKAYIRFSLI